MRLAKLIPFFGFIAMLFAVPALASDPIYTSTFSDKAVGGYDTVAYFTENKAVKGDKDFSTEWRGAKWQFSSQENLDKFTADPEKYAPQYGGYCAYAVAKGGLAKGDPEAWHIYNGKLYLNFNKDVRAQWLPKKKELIPVADANYPQLVELSDTLSN